MMHTLLGMVAPLLLQGVAAPVLTTDMLVVFGIVAVALVFFVLELVPIDITAIGVMFVLIVLEPWTEIGPNDGISGFANPATVTVLAMFVLSEGIRRTGLVQRLGEHIVRVTKGSVAKQFAALTGLTSAVAGFINNTPVVAVMVPMASDIARQSRVSPSKFLMPISFAAMMGGMLTLIGTSTNILASDVSARLIDHPFSMFEFTSLGLLVTAVGLLYLFFVGRHLIPERVKPEEALTEHFEMDAYLTEVKVHAASPLVGHTVDEALRQLRHDAKVDADIVHLRRDSHEFAPPLARKEVRADDELLIRTDRANLERLLRTEALDVVHDTQIMNGYLRPAADGHLVEVIVLPDTSIVGQTIDALNFQQRFESSVLAIRHRGDIIHQRIEAHTLVGGDSLLVLAPDRAIEQMARDTRFVVTERAGPAAFRTSKRYMALAIVGAVVLLSAVEVVPILVAALGGILAMVGTGCLRPGEVYQAINWPVIFLLAGMIPLGTALERTGGAEYLASLIVSPAEGLPAFIVLVIFYAFTAVLTEVVSNNASVVLMIPVAVNAAQLIDANPFAFVLAVTFAASTAMMTPIGYQTNLMVYGPGGYRFTDFFRVGAPLQLILGVVTTVGIYFMWGV